jgi:CheY-like chemotaxis protein
MDCEGFFDFPANCRFDVLILGWKDEDMSGRERTNDRRFRRSSIWVGPEDVVGSSDALTVETESSQGTEPSKRRLLLVEDDWRTHNALRKILGKLGWDVQSAMTVSGGLALLDQNPDAIILDLMLPDGDGEAVLRKARAECPLTRIAITTGVEDHVRLEEIRNLQPDALLRKPLDLDELLQVIGSSRSA